MLVQSRPWRLEDSEQFRRGNRHKFTRTMQAAVF
jgi:hypothetical protein